MATAELHTSLESKVIDYLQDAHAMEQNVLRMLDSMISTTTDPETLSRLKRHRLETEQHRRSVRERLEALGASPSLAEDVPSIMMAWLKGVADQVRSDKPGKNARDGFVTEHLEIAAYALLEQLAMRAGDLETARVARFNREDEQDMARWIAARWGKFINLDLAEAGFHLPPQLQSGPIRHGGTNQAFTYLGLAAALGAGCYLLSRAWRS